MIDIITRLSALTAKDDASPIPACPFCGSFQGSSKHDDGRHWWHCDNCAATGPLTSRYSDPENGDAVWETRPREAALIALVQEAASEIERLRKLATESRDALDAVIPCVGRDSSSFSTVYALKQAREQRERCEQAINAREATS